MIKSKIESKESTEDKLRQVAKKLQNVILKVGIKLDPINFEFLDDTLRNDGKNPVPKCLRFSDNIEVRAFVG